MTETVPEACLQKASQTPPCSSSPKEVVQLPAEGKQYDEFLEMIEKLNEENRDLQKRFADAEKSRYQSVKERDLKNAQLSTETRKYTLLQEEHSMLKEIIAGLHAENQEVKGELHQAGHSSSIAQLAKVTSMKQAYADDTAHLKHVVSTTEKQVTELENALEKQIVETTLQRQNSSNLSEQLTCSQKQLRQLLRQTQQRFDTAMDLFAVLSHKDDTKIMEKYIQLVQDRIAAATNFEGAMIIGLSEKGDVYYSCSSSDTEPCLKTTEIQQVSEWQSLFGNRDTKILVKRQAISHLLRGTTDMQILLENSSEKHYTTFESLVLYPCVANGTTHAFLVVWNTSSVKQRVVKHQDIVALQDFATMTSQLFSLTGRRVLAESHSRSHQRPLHQPAGVAVERHTSDGSLY